MALFVTGLALFFATHMLPTLTATRANLTDRLGAQPYNILVSLVALAGFVALVYGYGQAQMSGFGSTQLWFPPDWTRHVTYLLMLPVFPLLVATYAPAGAIKRAVKHPMILAVKFWALSHLLVNGDVASMVLFGTFLAWAIYDRISLKRRDAATGRTIEAGSVRWDILAVGVGLALYMAFIIWGHPLLIGVALIPAGG